ncbi:MAG: sugar transferase [Calditrichaceae bacterium]
MSKRNKIIKRIFDVLFSFIGLILFSWLIFIAFVLASITTKSSGFFIQERIGRNGRKFKIIKIKTMISNPQISSCVTTENDPRITRLGKIFRKTKIDELPQLLNVLIGDMSFVGPRPDVESYYVNLSENDKIILTVRPGITGPATLKYRNEEKILSMQENPEQYSRNIIFPNKIALNKDYIKNYGLNKDFYYIFKTIFK